MQVETLTLKNINSSKLSSQEMLNVVSRKLISMFINSTPFTRNGVLFSTICYCLKSNNKDACVFHVKEMFDHVRAYFDKNSGVYLNKSVTLELEHNFQRCLITLAHEIGHLVHNEEIVEKNCNKSINVIRTALPYSFFHMFKNFFDEQTLKDIYHFYYLNDENEQFAIQFSVKVVNDILNNTETLIKNEYINNEKALVFLNRIEQNREFLERYKAELKMDYEETKLSALKHVELINSVCKNCQLNNLENMMLKTEDMSRFILSQNIIPNQKIAKDMLVKLLHQKNFKLVEMLMFEPIIEVPQECFQYYAYLLIKNKQFDALSKLEKHFDKSEFETYIKNKFNLMKGVKEFKKLRIYTKDLSL